MSSVNTSFSAPPLLASVGTLPSRGEGATEVAAVPSVAVSAKPSPDLTAPVAAVAKPNTEAVVQAARQIESFLNSVGRSLNFSVDPITGDNVLRVLNPENGEVVRQLPSEEALRIARAIDYMQSALVNQRA